MLLQDGIGLPLAKNVSSPTPTYGVNAPLAGLPSTTVAERSKPEEVFTAPSLTIEVGNEVLLPNEQFGAHGPNCKSTGAEAEGAKLLLPEKCATTAKPPSTKSVKHEAVPPFAPAGRETA